MRNYLTMAKRFLLSRIGRPLVRRADTHRNRSDWIEAVVGYRRGLDWMPWREDLNIQIGNCFKEYGDYRSAVKAYSAVKSGAHRTDALREMADANRRAGSEILPYVITDRADKSGTGLDTAPALPPPHIRDLPNRISIETEDPRRWLGRLGRDDNRATRARGNSYPSILFDQIGSLSIQRDGAIEPLLTGIVALRLRIFSQAKLDTIELWLGKGKAATLIETAPVSLVERGIVQIRMHVANIWIDSARLPAGRHWISVRAGSHAPETGLFVNVAEPGAIAGLASSDAYVPVSAGDGDPARAIAAAPAQHRAAGRSLFDRPIRSILAIRVDQLGDVSASLPAVVRLRALFPEAELTMLVQPGVRGMIEASGLADKVVTIRLDYSEITERRTLAADEEARVRALLDEGAFDLAIDLSPGDETRPLLLMTGATYLVGFDADRFTFLDYGVTLRSRDKVNQLGKISHAASVMTLIESLAVAVTPTFPPVPRMAASDAVLSQHGLVPQTYVVLHVGARHAINRWPLGHFLDLAERLVRETSSRVVIFSDVPDDRPRPALRSNERVTFFDIIDSDSFDAILSNAKLMIGNDSGPKHLAATRGVATVSIHIDRLNWNEWGQHGKGTILSKRVPCTGCGLNDIQLCGREAVCVRSIGVDEVMEAVRAFL